jgi:phthiodiolone/phenolphthiodiolone dimycocerosates ketoreductase
MSGRPVETAVAVNASRHFPPSQFADAARALQQSGVVDYLLAWDQMVSWWPPSLWTPENAPMAKVMPDLDSFPDAFATVAHAAAAAPDLGMAISTDGGRRGPSELMQTMLTLADMTGGKAMFQLGAGELKQMKPYGWKRSEGLARLEDTLRLFHRFWESDAPIDFEGNQWTLQRAWLGSARTNRPQVWGLGGGPKLLDLTTSYADGFATVVPFVASSPEKWAAMVTGMKQELERKGRDPDAFGFGLWASVLLHEDPAMIERAYENPLIRFFAGIAGRINQADWDEEGIEPVFPRNWHYAMKLLPQSMSASEVDDIVARVPREMTVKSYISGSPEEVASTLQDYVEAGATWICMIDSLAFILEPEQAPAAFGRSIEVARALKAPAPTPATEARSGQT